MGLNLFRRQEQDSLVEDCQQAAVVPLDHAEAKLALLLHLGDGLEVIVSRVIEIILPGISVHIGIIRPTAVHGPDAFPDGIEVEDILYAGRLIAAAGYLRLPQPNDAVFTDIARFISCARS